MASTKANMAYVSVIIYPSTVNYQLIKQRRAVFVQTFEYCAYQRLTDHIRAVAVLVPLTVTRDRAQFAIIEQHRDRMIPRLPLELSR